MEQDRTPFHIETPFGPLVFERLANIYRQARGRAKSPSEFAAAALDFLQVRFELDEQQLAQIPRTGPAVVVANHPYGGLEGLFLIAQIQRYRKDSLFIAN